MLRDWRLWWPVPALVLVVLVLLIIGRHFRRQPQGDPVVDSAVATAPAVHETTTVVIDASQQVQQLAKARADTIAHLLRRVRTRDDSINALEAELASGADTDTLGNTQKRLGLCTAQKLDLDAALTSCRQTQHLLLGDVGNLQRQLTRVQARADSMPLLINRAVAAKPCTRNWLLAHPSCSTAEAILFVAGAAAGFAVAK